MTDLLVRALLLIEQQRWDLAERELRRTLAAESQNGEAHRLLALCLLQKQQYDEAEAEAQAAIHLQPDDSNTHLMLGWVLFSRRKYAEAGAAAQESIRLSPDRPSAFALVSQLAFQRSRWQEALAAAERGLALDPEDTECNNLQAMALVKLGRRAEAGRTIGAALARDPLDPLTHANQGWTLLESGDPKQAMLHFREALRLDPNQEWARLGIVEALKAKNFVYRLCLNYFLFMSKLSPQTQWVVVVGLFILQRVASSIGNGSPALAPFIQPILILYLVFALLTWLGSPLFDLLLCLDQFGRLVLSSEQKQRALAVGGLLLAAAMAWGASALLNDRLLLWAAFDFALLAIPASAIHSCPEGWPRWTMFAGTLALGVIGGLPLAVDILSRFELITIAAAKELLGLTSRTFIWGIVGSQFLANALANATVRR